MTKGAKRGSKKSAATHGMAFRVARVAAVWIMAFVVAFAVTKRGILPSTVRDNQKIIALYDWRDRTRDHLLNKAPAPAPADIEPAAGSKGVGYSNTDRNKLDALIEQQAAPKQP